MGARFPGRSNNLLLVKTRCMLQRRIIKKKEWIDLVNDLQSLKATVDNATQFVREIEKGNLNVELDDNGTASELSSSLISMRDQMKSFSIAEKERSWVNEGLAKFVEILRSRNNDTLKSLSESILQSLVSYMQANQGALFLLDDDNPDEPFLEMTACYAYGRKKHLQKKLSVGEGLAGQAVLEKETIYLKEVPEDFVKITSGLGEATPRNILVVPLKLDEKVYGVVEIASFSLFKKYQIEFVEKLGESIASTISGVRANDKTKALLAETQSQAEEMRAQEEEMRQNMEELSSTQEEMQRILNEVQSHERFTREILDSSTDMIVTIDRDYKVLNFNKVLYDNFAKTGLFVEKGFDITLLNKPEARQRHIEKYKEAFSGKRVSLEEHYVYGNIDQYVIFMFSPIQNEKGEIHAISIYAKDVTEITTVKNEIENSQQSLHDLLNVTTDPTMTIDRDYKLVLFNKPYQESFTSMGFPIAVGFEVLEIFQDPEVMAERKKIYDRVFKGEIIERADTLKIGGNDFHYVTKHAPVYDRKGNINTIAIIAKDVTEITIARNAAQQQNEELKAQEEELRQNMEELASTQEEMQRILNEVQSHERFTREILDSSTDMIVTIDRDYKVLNFNKALYDNFSKGDFVVEKGIDIGLFVKPEDRPRHVEMYKQAFSGKRCSLDEHYVFGDIDQYIVFTFSPIRNEQGEINAVSIYAKDVTEITTAKNEIENSQQYLHDLLNVTTDPTMTIDRHFKLVMFNKPYQESFTKMGLPIEVGFNVLEIFKDPEVIEGKKKIYNRVFNGESIEQPEKVTVGGQDLYFVTKHAPIFDRSGNINTIAIIAKDVTEITKARNAAQQQNEELKAQEEELRQNMEELAATQEEMSRVLTEVQNKEAFVTGLINASNDSIVTLDKDFCILNFNATFKAAYQGLDIKIEKGIPISRLASTRADADAYEANYRRAFNGESFRIEQEYNFGNITAYYDVNYVPMRDAEGNVYAIAIFTKDVTELTVSKKKTEELLNESQQQAEELKAQEEQLRQNMEELAATQEVINQQYASSEKMRQELHLREMVLGLTTLLSESDLHGNITHANEKLCAVAQYTADELIGKPHNILRHPDMPKELFKKLWTNLKAGKTFRGIIKNRKKDGGHYWVDATVMPVKDDKGKVFKYVSSRYHIENDKHAEELYEKQIRSWK